MELGNIGGVGGHSHGSGGAATPTGANGSTDFATSGGMDPASAMLGKTGGGEIGQALSQIEEMLKLLVEMLQQVVEQMSGGASSGDTGGPQGAIAPDGGGAPIAEDTPPGGAGEKIPPPSEHVQTFNLGGKQVTIGGDGSANAQEVQQTAQTMQRMYETSPTFRQQIDGNPNDQLSVTVGKRADNTSWGHTNGSVYMNLNNIDPSSNDTFESIMSHEIAHTQGHGHGHEIESLESAVAAEAR